MASAEDNVLVPVLTAADYPSVFVDAERDYYGRRDELREKAPVYRVEMTDNLTYYTVMRDDLVKQVLMDPETFPNAIGASPHSMLPTLPASKEGQELLRYRAVVQRWVNPQNVRRAEDKMREFAIELIEPLVAKGGCNFQHDIGEFYPGLVMLEVFSLDRSYLAELVEIESLLWVVPEDDPDYAVRREAAAKLDAWIEARIAECQAKPNDSVVSQLLATEIQGTLLTPFEVKMFVFFFIVGGLHTTKALMGKMMAILAEDTPMRHRLTASPELWPRFIEEALRSHAMGESFRRVAKDTELAGVQLKEGDLVTVNWTAANRDPRAYRNPTEINLDEAQSARHTGFGYGGHICMGMHLARADMRIMLEEWHKRIPDYKVPEGTVLREQSWAGFGLLELPLLWPVQA